MNINKYDDLQLTFKGEFLHYINTTQINKTRQRESTKPSILYKEWNLKDLFFFKDDSVEFYLWLTMGLDQLFH